MKNKDNRSGGGNITSEPMRDGETSRAGSNRSIKKKLKRALTSPVKRDKHKAEKVAEMRKSESDGALLLENGGALQTKKVSPTKRKGLNLLRKLQKSSTGKDKGDSPHRKKNLWKALR